MAESIEYAKVTETTLQKTETVVVVSEISIDALLARRQQYIEAKNAAIEYNDKCIADIDFDIAEATKLNVKTKAVFEAEEIARFEALEGTTPEEL
jgi:hypothetical protein